MKETPGSPARVLVCDDSLVIRRAITRMLAGARGIEVVATASHGQAAVEIVRAHLDAMPIDIVVLDIEMPVMDGLTALPLLLAADPKLRVIMASTLTMRGAAITMDALRLGAADYIPKPNAAGLFDDRAFADELCAKIRGLARLRSAPAFPSRTAPTREATRPRPDHARSRPGLLAIGSSTGGPQALFTLFRDLGRAIDVPVILTQHMPATFVPMLAEHITRVGGLPCAVARQGDTLVAGRITIAPGDRHLQLASGANGARAVLSDGPPVNFCRPAVDVMLESAAVAFGSRVLVVMLTGMGRDGCEGTRRVVEAGGAALAQDEATSVVWGMPGAIAAAGLADEILPLGELAGAVKRRLAGPA